MTYTFRATGKGNFGAPKGLSVTFTRAYSSPDMTSIIKAFKEQHGLTVAGTLSNYDIEKL